MTLGSCVRSGLPHRPGRGHPAHARRSDIAPVRHASEALLSWPMSPLLPGDGSVIAIFSQEWRR